MSPAVMWNETTSPTQFAGSDFGPPSIAGTANDPTTIPTVAKPIEERSQHPEELPDSCAVLAGGQRR